MNRRRLRKQTIEEALAIDMKDFRKRLFLGATGTLTWTRRFGTSSSVRFSVGSPDGSPVLCLEYQHRGTEDVIVPIRLTATPTQFQGRRLWFVCPLSVGGVSCNRRARKLYLPPGETYFGCRLCHDLTYRSSQESHRIERLFGRLGTN